MALVRKKVTSIKWPITITSPSDGGKWVDETFIPEDNKRELIEICGHYVFSDERFLNMKPHIDDKIKTVIKNKLRRLNELT